VKIVSRVRSVIARELPFALATPAVLWVVLFLCIPLAMMIGISLYQPGVSWWQAVTLSRYMTFFDFIYLRIIFRSLFLSAGTALLCLCSGYPIAYYLSIRAGRWKGVLLFLLSLPFWTNFIIQMYAWFFLLEHEGLINTMLLWSGLVREPIHLIYTTGSVLLVMVYCYLPFMIMPLYSVLQRFDKRLLEASMDLGATWRETFFRVTLPLSLSGVKIGVLLVFIPAFGEFAIPALIGGSRHFTIGSLIVHYFLVVHDIALGAALTCLSGIILLCCSLLWYRCFFGKRIV